MQQPLSPVQVNMYCLELSVAFFTCAIEYFNIHGTPSSPENIYPVEHIFCSLSSNFDLTLPVSLPKSVLMSPIPYHQTPVSARGGMIHCEQSGSSSNLFPYLSNYF